MPAESLVVVKEPIKETGGGIPQAFLDSFGDRRKKPTAYFRIEPKLEEYIRNAINPHSAPEHAKSINRNFISLITEIYEKMQKMQEHFAVYSENFFLFSNSIGTSGAVDLHMLHTPYDLSEERFIGLFFRCGTFDPKNFVNTKVSEPRFEYTPNLEQTITHFTGYGRWAYESYLALLVLVQDSEKEIVLKGICTNLGYQTRDIY